MDRLLIYTVIFLTAISYFVFTITDVYRYTVNYAILIVIGIFYLVEYTRFSSIVRCGFLLLISQKYYECLVGLIEFEIWLGQGFLVDLIFGDIFVVAGLLFVAKGFLLVLRKQSYLINRDPHTRSYNKLAIERILHSELRNGKVHRHDTSILIVDIDNFKCFNDNYGHQLGDEALIVVAEHLQNKIRASDSLSRWGGDEFVIACPNTSQIEAVHIMKRIQHSANEELFIESVPIKLSIGAATSEYSTDTLNQLFSKADSALYQVKREGRNGYKHYQQDELVKYDTNLSF